MRQEALEPEQLQLEREDERIDRGPPTRLRHPRVQRIEKSRQGEERAIVPLLFCIETEHRLEADQPDLEADYGAWLPMLVVGGQKLALSSTYRPIAQFLDVTLGRLA